jgi:hypothetical protein
MADVGEHTFTGTRGGVTVREWSHGPAIRTRSLPRCVRPPTTVRVVCDLGRRTRNGMR